MDEINELRTFLFDSLKHSIKMFVLRGGHFQKAEGKFLLEFKHDERAGKSTLPDRLDFSSPLSLSLSVKTLFVL